MNNKITSLLHRGFSALHLPLPKAWKPLGVASAALLSFVTESMKMIPEMILDCGLGDLLS